MFLLKEWLLLGRLDDKKRLGKIVAQRKSKGSGAQFSRENSKCNSNIPYPITKTSNPCGVLGFEQVRVGADFLQVNEAFFFRTCGPADATPYAD